MTINNRLLKTLKCCLALLMVSLIAPFAAHAVDMDSANTLAYSNQKLRGQDKNYQPVNSWTPYFTWIGNVQDQNKTTFAEATIGVGFLYLSKSKGNLVSVANGPGQGDSGAVLPKGMGSMSYNRTPIYEWMYGYKVFSWLSAALSIQNQNSVNVQTQYVEGTIPAGFALTGNTFYQFRSQLGINALMLKANFELPWVLVWKNWMYAAYLSLGVGPAWQSWTDNRVFKQSFSGPLRLTYVNTLAQKYSVSCAFQVDAGFRMKPAVMPADISILWGCKFNEWGQVRNIGKVTQQGSWNRGLASPFRSRVLYSFAPYLGFQWSF